MPENAVSETQEAKAEKTFTQAELDAIVKERVARVKREAPSDYEELQKKAKAYDEAIEAEKSELQKAQEESERLKAELDGVRKRMQRDSDVTRIAAEMNVDSALLSRMSGSTPEEIRENAKALASAFDAKSLYPSTMDAGEARKPSTTKAEILAIEDRRERENAILANLELFN